MRILAIAVLIALFLVAPARAQIKPAPTKAQPFATPKAQPEKRAKACEEYGAGFKPIEGTGTCVKIGGYVRMQDSVR